MKAYKLFRMINFKRKIIGENEIVYSRDEGKKEIIVDFFYIRHSLKYYTVYEKEYFNREKDNFTINMVEVDPYLNDLIQRQIEEIKEGKAIWTG